MIQEYLHEKRMKVIKKYLNVTADLDIGAGKKPKAGISIDISRDSKPHMVADVRYLPIREESVNSIVCSHVIEHVNDLDMAMNEIKRILNKNGKVVFFLPDDGSRFWKLIRPLWTIYYEKAVSKADSPRTHAHTFNYDSFREFVESIFEPVEVGKMNLGMEIYAICKRH